MSDIEEPPMKVTKLEELEWQQIESLDPEFTEGEVEGLDEGQEEWLSEGAYTDDDNPVTDQQNVDTTQEQDDTLPSVTSEHLDDSQDLMDPSLTEKESNIEGQNIEETLNNLEGSKEDDLPDDLDTFLIRKTDGVVVGPNAKEEVDRIEKEDDGNDTDDLLRMLGDGDDKTKKKVLKTLKVKNDSKQDNSSDDDDDDDDDDHFVYEGMKSLPAAGRATRAEPEHSDADLDTDASSDEVATMKKMFGVVKKQNVASKSTTKLPTSQKKPLVKHVVQINNVNSKKSNNSSHAKTKDQSKSILKPATPAKPEVKSVKKQSVSFKSSPILKSTSKVTSAKSEVTPTPKYVDKASKAFDKLIGKSSDRTTSKSFEKTTPNSEGKTFTKLKSYKVDEKTKSKLSLKSEESPASKSMGVLKPENSLDMEPDEIINEEEFLDEEEFDLDEDLFGEESEMEVDTSASKQRIMRPEIMDEEVPTDEESHSEDGSLYDELPSSDSDDLDDWFTLDIRAERAGDYIPLLGANANKLLMNEKYRVEERLANLRESLTSLTETGRKQAEQLKEATMTLAELDDMLKAS